MAAPGNISPKNGQFSPILPQTVCYGAHDRQPCAPESTGSQGRTYACNGLKAPLQKARHLITDHKGSVHGCTREHYAEKTWLFSPILPQTVCHGAQDGQPCARRINWLSRTYAQAGNRLTAPLLKARSSLRSSSMHEPRGPPLEVVFSDCQQKNQTSKFGEKNGARERSGPDFNGLSLQPEKSRSNSVMTKSSKELARNV